MNWRSACVLAPTRLVHHIIVPGYGERLPVASVTGREAATFSELDYLYVQTAEWRWAVVE